MGGQTPACCRGFPSCYFHTLRVLGGVAGWNTNRKSFADCGVKGEFGTLLGPEKTSGCWWMFLWPAVLGPDRLTHSLCGGCGGGCGGFGVWWCVECCIVDASIFFCVWFCGLCVFVVCEVL